MDDHVNVEPKTPMKESSNGESFSPWYYHDHRITTLAQQFLKQIGRELVENKISKENHLFESFAEKKT